MKQLTFIFLFFFTTSSFFSQNIQKTENSKIEILDKKVDSLINIQNESKVAILENRILQATETIANQNAMITSFGTLYTVITIILALIGIVLPILTYQFGIKPSQKALEDFEKNSEKKFNDFLIGSRTREIDNAINNLTDKDSAIRNSAINFLSLNYHTAISEKQLQNIINILENNEDLDDTTISQLYHVMSNQKSGIVKKYFEKNITTANITEDNLFLYYAIKTFSFYPYDTYKNSIKSYIKNEPEKFLELITYLQATSKKNLSDLINDENIIDELKSDEIKKLKTSIEYYIDDWKDNENVYKKTYLGKKLID